jgi:hypothetical protein
MCPGWPLQDQELWRQVVQLGIISLFRKFSLGVYPMHLHMITPCAKCRVIKTAGDRIIERIECRGIVNSFHGNSFDLVAGQDTEIDACNRGGNRL